MRLASIVALLMLLGCKRGAEPVAAGEPAAAASKAASSAAVKPVSSAEVRGKRVDVRAGADGFHPSSVTVKQNEPTTLVFTRKTNETCATEVVFPEINLKKELPLNEEVAIAVPVDKARTLGFECGMAMFKSKVVIE